LVTWLHVRYEEKDHARALGARWSQAEKKWFVPDGVDPAPFEMWFPKPPEPPKSMQSVPRTEYVQSDGVGPQLGTQTVALEILTDACWKCHETIDMVSGILLPPNVEQIQDWRVWQPRFYLHLPLNHLSDHQGLADAVSTLRQKPEYSATLTPVSNVAFSSARYFACSCPKCSAGQGDFPMMERRLELFMTAENGLKPERVRYEPIVITITKDDLTEPGFEVSDWVVGFPDDRVFVDNDEEELGPRLNL
jgi:hypothetical protein